MSIFETEKFLKSCTPVELQDRFNVRLKEGDPSYRRTLEFYVNDLYLGYLTLFVWEHKSEYIPHNCMELYIFDPQKTLETKKVKRRGFGALALVSALQFLINQNVDYSTYLIHSRTHNEEFEGFAKAIDAEDLLETETPRLTVQELLDKSTAYVKSKGYRF